VAERFSRSLIKLARHEAGMSQRDLAEAAGTSQAAISAYESGRRSPSVDTLCRIVAATGKEVRMRLDEPDTHTAARIQGEKLYPPEQIAAHYARQEARLEALRAKPRTRPEKPYLREMSGQEFNEMLQGGAPATADDVTITGDGRRLDTKDKVLAYVAELANKNAS
jgi:transcriptional regulator with XRE-family HTH domain